MTADLVPVASTDTPYLLDTYEVLVLVASPAMPAKTKGGRSISFSPARWRSPMSVPGVLVAVASSHQSPYVVQVPVHKYQYKYEYPYHR
jgi:hypothetical protein